MYIITNITVKYILYPVKKNLSGLYTISSHNKLNISPLLYLIYNMKLILQDKTLSGSL